MARLHRVPSLSRARHRTDAPLQKPGSSLNLRPHARCQLGQGVMRHGPTGGSTSRGLSVGPPEGEHPAHRHRGRLLAQVQPTLRGKPSCEARHRGHHGTWWQSTRAAAAPGLCTGSFPRPASPSEPRKPLRNQQPTEPHRRSEPHARSEHSFGFQQSTLLRWFTTSKARSTGHDRAALQAWEEGQAEPRRHCSMPPRGQPALVPLSCCDRQLGTPVRF